MNTEEKMNLLLDKIIEKLNTDPDYTINGLSDNIIDKLIDKIMANPELLKNFNL